VEARFDVLPPLPAPAGIVGVVGIVDRSPAEGGLVSVNKVTELRDVLGPGTEASMPEVAHALANGASEAVIAPVTGGSTASVPLKNADSKDAVLLRCRSNGTWGNRLSADLRGITAADGSIVRVTLRLLLAGQIVESFSDLQVAPGQPDDLFDTINSRSRFVVALDPGFVGKIPASNTFTFDEAHTILPVAEKDAAADAAPLAQLLPADGVDANGLSVRLAVKEENKIQLQVFQNGLQEQFDELELNPDSDHYLPYVLLAQSRFVRLQPLNSLEIGKRLPRPTDAPLPFTGGTSPTVAQYLEAIDLLSDDTRIDLVLASIEPARSDAEVRQIHQALLAHAVAMADAGAPRIAFGSVTRAEQSSLQKIRDHAAAVRNRRFVLVSPSGAEGAVAGAIGRLDPQDSPTFKPLPLFGINPATYRESELNRLLGPNTNLLVAQDRAGRGVVVLKGIDTTGDQISVTRVADGAIRETKAISENFIGQLNSEEARIALKQQLFATFTRMERDGALVPSTDGKDPAFLVDVFSTQQDFAQGIVRINIAVRPVRAIDYVYATIRVKI
jgi:hypothetical protein